MWFVVLSDTGETYCWVVQGHIICVGLALRIRFRISGGVSAAHVRHDMDFGGPGPIIPPSNNVQSEVAGYVLLLDQLLDLRVVDTGDLLFVQKVLLLGDVVDQFEPGFLESEL